jgi:hypothetical protein
MNTLLFLFIILPHTVSTSTTPAPRKADDNILAAPAAALAGLSLPEIHELATLLRKIKASPPQQRRLSPTAASASDLPVATQDFAFVVSHFNSSRQFGKCLNVIIKYRYILGTRANSTGGGYLDYREVRRLVLKFAQPSTKLPMIVQWELINEELVKEIFSKYGGQITAVSSQIQVLSEINPDISEPGNHGSIVTIGQDATFVPLAEPWINAFRFDCTRTNSTTEMARDGP